MLTTEQLLASLTVSQPLIEKIEAMYSKKKLVDAGICKAIDLPIWEHELERVATQYRINDNLTRHTMWLAQIAYESAHCTHLEENLRYSNERLLAVFPHYFNENDTARFAYNPKAIASRVYANRMGNGDEGSGEGYTYRGRGLIMLTGKFMYAQFGKTIGMEAEIIANPDLVATPHYAAESAGWFWQTHGCNALADAQDFIGVTRRINGGLHGLAARQSIYTLVQQVFAES